MRLILETKTGMRFIIITTSLGCDEAIDNCGCVWYRIDNNADYPEFDSWENQTTGEFAVRYKVERN